MSFLIFFFLLSLSFSLDLETLWKKALEKNPSIAAFRRDVEASFFQLKASKNLYLPHVEIFYKFTYQNEEQRLKLDLGLINGDFRTLKDRYQSFGVSLRELLYDFGARESYVKISQKLLEIKKLLYEEKKEDILLEVALAYLDTLSAKNLIEVYKKQKEAVKSQYELSKAYYEKGLVAITDILEARVKLSEVERKLKRAQANYRISLSNLSRLTKVSEKDLEKLSQPKLNVRIKDLDFYIGEALKRRSLLKAYLKRIEIEKLKEKIKLSLFLPKIFLEVSYLYTNQNPIVYPKGLTFFSVGTSLSFRGIQPYYENLSVKAQKKKVLKEYEEMADLIKLDVKRAYEELKTAKENLKVTSQALEFAKKHYELSLEQYRNQLISQTQLLIAEARLTEARKALIISRYEFLKAYFKLLRASGLLKIGGGLGK
ncbi:MAG: TolC family protein [Aquifex sp.]|nr:MAG: TolC family protein [Aquifex sp.]